MAKSDGSIIIDTKIDVSGIKAGTVDINKQMDRLSVQVKGVAASIKAAMGGGAVATAKLKAQAEILEEKIEHLKQKADEYGKSEVPTDEYKALNEEISKTNEQLNKLEERRARMKSTGVSEDAQSWKNVNYDINMARQQLSGYLAEKTKMESGGTAYKAGSSTNEYAEMLNSLTAAKARLAEMQGQLNKSNGFMSRLAAGAKNFFAHIGNAAKTIGGKILSGIKAAASGIGSLISRAKAMKTPFNGLSASLKKIAPAMLATEGVMGILRKAVNAYLSENQELSNTLSSLWSNIGNALGPIISKIVNLVASAVAYFSKFLQLLGATGSTATKSIESAGGSASKETKKLQRTMASFDEITTLGGKESESGGGGGGQSGVTTAEVTMPDWAQMMIDQLKGGNWAEAATTLTTQLNNAMATVDWSGIGSTIAQYFDGALTFLATALMSFDWFGLGTNLATGLNSIITGVDWGNLGIILASGVRILVEGLGGLFATLDWMALGAALSDALMGAWNSIDWAKAGKMISDGAIGALNAISTAIKKTDWKKIGKDVAKFVSSIDWSGVLSALSDGIGAALGGLAALLWGFIEDGWNSVIDWWHENAMEDGEFTISGLLKGIGDALKNIGNWIRINVWEPFKKGFCEAFGIHSPSTKFAEFGKYIIEGLFNGIKNTWNTITSFFSTSLNSVKNTISNAWSNVKTNTSTAWNNIKSDISTKWNNIKSDASSTWDTIKNNLSTKWNSVKSDASAKFTDAKNSILNAWDAVKNSKTWDTIKNNLSTAWSGIKSNASTKFTEIKNTISDLWDKTMDAFTGGKIDFSVIGSNIQDVFRDALNKLISGLNSALQKPIKKLNLAILDLKYTEFWGMMPFKGLSLLPVPEIPYLAKGAVIPPNAPFMAMLGDQRHGTNIEAPLSTIQEAVALVMEDMAGGLMAGFESTVAVLREILEAILGIEIGDSVIAEAVDRYNRKMAVVKGG